MKRIVTVALLALASAARAEDAVKTTEATGQAAVADDLLAAKAAAKDDALRNCVQQVATTIVSASTESDQAQLLSDKVFSHSVGYVRKFTILEDKQDGNTWVTRLRCDVSEAKLDEDMMAFGIAYRRAGMPRVMTLIAEQSITATKATGWWQGGGNSSDLRVMENAFMDRMEKSGFTFIDPEVLSGKLTLEAVGADPNVQKAREIGRLAGAEVVVIGRAIAKPLGEMAIDNGTFYSAVANVSARAVRTDTGEVIAAAEFTGNAGKGFEQATAGRNALSEAGRKLARDLFAKIGAAWSREQSGSRRIALVVKGVEDYARLATFKNVLVNSLRGVKDVQQRSVEEGRAELDVQLAGTAESFATDLAIHKFQGYVCKVKKVTPNAVEVELK
jgi:curli biogenesis system outer membrane secretion channel CsgG